jgi:hypothetical protein
MTTSELIAVMRQYAHWKNQRNTIIKQALSHGMPVRRISDEMTVSRDLIERIKKNGNSSHIVRKTPQDKAMEAFLKGVEWGRKNAETIPDENKRATGTN